MYKTYSFTLKSIIYFIFLTSMHISECWTVKVINLTDEKITVDINSSQTYLGWKNGFTKRRCEFVGKQIDAYSTRDFNYKDVNPICIAPCTKSVAITSPITLRSENKLFSCSNVVVAVYKDESNVWSIEYHDWTDNIIRILRERIRMPLKVRNIYDQLGNSPIQAISVFRKPIQAGVRKLMKIVTRNELKQLHYDELYHTGFIITCQDLSIRLERTETIASTIQIMKPEDEKKMETRAIVLPEKAISYNEFINNAMENDPDFWKYHPVARNCQLFVLQCLEKNNIEVSDDLHKFIYQDIEQVLANSPILRNISIASTSLANRIGKIVEGINHVTVQNGTPYTIRVKTRYAGQSKFFRVCLADDFLLESGKEKTVSHGICLLDGIKVAASSQGIEAIKYIPHRQLQETADMFAQSSFMGKAGADFLIRLVNGVLTIDNIYVSTVQLERFAGKSQATITP